MVDAFRQGQQETFELVQLFKRDMKTKTERLISTGNDDNFYRKLGDIIEWLHKACQAAASPQPLSGDLSDITESCCVRLPWASKPPLINITARL